MPGALRPDDGARRSPGQRGEGRDRAHDTEWHCGEPERRGDCRNEGDAPRARPSEPEHRGDEDQRQPFQVDERRVSFGPLEVPRQRREREARPRGRGRAGAEHAREQVHRRAGQREAQQEQRVVCADRPECPRGQDGRPVDERGARLGSDALLLRERGADAVTLRDGESAEVVAVARTRQPLDRRSSVARVAGDVIAHPHSERPRDEDGKDCVCGKCGRSLGGPPDPTWRPKLRRRAAPVGGGDRRRNCVGVHPGARLYGRSTRVRVAGRGRSTMAAVADADHVIDVERLVLELKERVERQRSAGAYTEEFAVPSAARRRRPRPVGPAAAASPLVPAAPAPPPRVTFLPGDRYRSPRTCRRVADQLLPPARAAARASGARRRGAAGGCGGCRAARPPRAGRGCALRRDARQGVSPARARARARPLCAPTTSCSELVPTLRRPRCARTTSRSELASTPSRRAARRPRVVPNSRRRRADRAARRPRVVPNSRRAPSRPLCAPTTSRSGLVPKTSRLPSVRSTRSCTSGTTTSATATTSGSSAWRRRPRRRSRAHADTIRGISEHVRVLDSRTAALERRPEASADTSDGGAATGGRGAAAPAP